MGFTRSTPSNSVCFMFTARFTTKVLAYIIIIIAVLVLFNWIAILIKKYFLDEFPVASI